MRHAKYQEHRTAGSREEDFKSFDHLSALRSSWSCDFYINFRPPYHGGPRKIWL